jgi:predicted dienelactone hydrolase
LRFFCLRSGLAPRAPHNCTGFTYVTVPGNTALRSDTSGRLKLVLWYPVSAPTAVRPIVLGPPHAPYFSKGRAAVDAPVADTPAHFPLVVVSHGTGGTAMDLAWLCAGLAARAYIVAAVNHPGNNALERPTVPGSTVWWLRADDLSRVIDGVLTMPRLASRTMRFSSTARLRAARNFRRSAPARNPSAAPSTVTPSN